MRDAAQAEYRVGVVMVARWSRAPRQLNGRRERRAIFSPPPAREARGGEGSGGGAANSLLKECVERPPTPDPSPPIRGGRGEETARRCIATISHRHLSV